VTFWLARSKMRRMMRDMLTAPVNEVREDQKKMPPYRSAESWVGRRAVARHCSISMEEPGSTVTSWNGTDNNFF
jgi:hypothetical protein